MKKFLKVIGIALIIGASGGSTALIIKFLIKVIKEWFMGG